MAPKPAKVEAAAPVASVNYLVENAVAIPECAEAISKLDWSKPNKPAHQGKKEMIAISSRELRPGNTVTKINDNPNTGDYSVGCLQVNIIRASGADNLSNIARISRQYGYVGGTNQGELGTWLGIPDNNIAVANYLYKHSTIARQWPNTSRDLGIHD